MPTPQPGRRERNKQVKLERIIAAASELFAAHGVDEVTTGQIADAADVGAGTLFLYAKTKGELLLLVQNAHYRQSLERGCAAASTIGDVLDAVLAIVEPIVACNRVHVGNGRTYLREMVFGDARQPQHAEALAIVGQTMDAVAAVLRRDPRFGEPEAATRARIISATMFVTMASGDTATWSVPEIVADLRQQISVLLA